MTHELETRIEQADVLCRQGRFDEAEVLYREALDLVDEAVGHDHLEAACLYRKLAELEHARGRTAEAEALARWGLRIRERELGPDHPEVAADRAVLAAILDSQAVTSPPPQGCLEPEPSHGQEGQEVEAQLRGAEGPVRRGLDLGR